MILTEVISMVNLLRELAGRKAQLDQDFFDNFINPIWLCFIEIHKDYKDSFARYAEMVIDDTKSAEFILDKIRTDSINTEDLRVNIAKMMQYLPYSSPHVPDDMIRNFLTLIGAYFRRLERFKIYEFKKEELARDIVLDYSLPNYVRYQAIIHISRQGSNIDRDDAKELFEGILSVIQKRYTKVADSFYAIKEKILA